MSIQSYFKQLPANSFPKFQPQKNLINSYFKNGSKDQNESLTNM